MILRSRCARSMQNLRPSSRAFVPAIAPLLFALWLGGCGHAPVMQPVGAPQVQLLGDAYEVGQVRSAIVRGLASRHFVAEGEQPGTVVARFERDGKQARVAVEYTELRYSIRLVASNMDSAAASGAPTVDATYFEWTRRLDRAIQEELKRIQKDSAAAAKAERDYQLMLEQAKAGGGQSGGGGDVAALLAPALLKAVPTTSVDIRSKTVSRH